MKANNYIVLVLIFFLVIDSGTIAQNKLPQFDINKSYFNFDRTLLFETKNDSIVISNIGDTLLVINKADLIIPPFFAKIITPDTLDVGEKVVYPVLYRPFKSGQDSQRVYINADTRQSNSIGLLIDVSNSMRDPMPKEWNVRRIDATNSAVRKFIDQMVFTQKVFDEAAVFTFAGNFNVNQNFTTDKNALKNSLTTNLRSYTYFYTACINTINVLKTRAYNRVLITLTDGEDNQLNGPYDADDVIAQANANKIRIFTISIGGNSNNNNSNLKRMAANTGGLYFEANTQKDLEDIYYQIFHLLSKNISLFFDLVGFCPTVQLSLACPQINQTTSPGDTLILKMDLKNLYSIGAINRDYKLKFSFNKSLILPLEEDFEYQDDGSVLIKGTVYNNLDSNYLKVIKFLTLIGDADCTDIVLEYILWDDNYYAGIFSGDACSVCISLCVRDIRQIISLKQNIISDIYPNPAQEDASINITINNAGVYYLRIYNSQGALVKQISDGFLSNGSYTYLLNTYQLSNGLYFLILESAQTMVNKPILIYN